MKVSSNADITRFHPTDGEGEAKIEFAIPSEGGNSSAGEKYNLTEKAVRLAWWSGDKRFDPISSAELPEWAVMDVMEACAAKEFFSPQQASQLIKVLSESLLRQHA